MKHSLVFIALLVLSSSVQAWDQCEYTRDFERTFNVSELENLAIEAGAGSLEIQGDGDADSVILKARACASSKESLKLLDVVFDANSATIKTQIPKNKGWNSYSSIDVDIKLPKRLNLDVRDSSGEASVENVAGLEMDDSSGELKVSDIAGNVKIVDSSGALSLDNIKGDVQLTDSSGEIKASDIDGNFTVLVDSSGAIDVKRVAKDVLIKVDSSGSIDVRDVGGDFTVGMDGSGGIRYKNVKGKVSLPTK